jgi:CheY-like chemotaxis protein
VATILFVDDEPAVLEGLQNRLRFWRHRRTLRFALGAEEALKVLATHPVDVIVSDLRMPGMDGAQLLDYVRQHYPQVVRILLSGHVSKHDEKQLLRVAHKIFSKPCDPNALDEAIEQQLH